MQASRVRSVTAIIFPLALLVAPSALFGQGTGIVRGQVTDAATGAPVADVQVTILRTTIGAVTRPNGEYLLPAVPAGQQTVVTRRIGYAPERREVTVLEGQTVTVDFTLRTAAVALDAVVVTGTATPTTKRALGTSVATVSGEEVEESTAPTVDAALQGRIAGAQITQNSGNPGGGGLTVRLRGTSSIISGSDPLYIVDGVIVDNSSDQLIDLGARSNVQNRLADLNPNDIERIEVIRGAAAAALYGSRANNGVVQIFTKRGRAGRPRVTINTQVGTQELANRYRMNLSPFNAAGEPVQRFDLQDQIFTTGNVIEHNASISGGNEGTTFFLSGNWYDEDGIIRNSGASRKGARLNLTQQLYPTLRLNLGANIINTHSDFGPNGEQTAGVLTALVFTRTDFDYSPRDGVFPFAPLGAFGFANPLNVIENFEAPQDVNRVIGSMRAEFNPLAALRMEYTLGYDGYQMEARQFIPRGAFPASYILSPGVATAVVRDSRILNNDVVATYTFRPNTTLELATSGGFNHTFQRIATTRATARDLIPTARLVGAGAVPGADQTLFELLTVGFYGQQTANWQDRLYVTGALRLDASSTFGPRERWQFYPKLDASYVISDEPWFAAGDLLTSLRLRSALGYAGNQPSPANAYARYESYARIVNDARVGAVNEITLGNESLRPERQREFEVGADVGLLEDRLSFEGTYYDKEVTDLLLFQPLPRTTGFTRQFANIGTMTNKGFELLARSVMRESARFRWESTVTYTRNRNRVEELNVLPFQSAAGYPNRVQEGEPVGIFYGSYFLRNPDGSLQLDSAGLPLRSADSKKIGDPNPDWYGSFLNEFRIGQSVRFRVLLDGTFGNDVMNLTQRIQDIFGTGEASARELLPADDPRRLPPGYLRRQGGIFEAYIEDGSFVKLREVSLAFQVPAAWAGAVRAGAAELTIAGRNLYTWTDYSGIDPELNLFGQRTVDRGFDFAGYPIPRTWSLGARLTY